MVMRKTGGEGGIRTHGGLTPTTVFEYVQKEDPGFPGPLLLTVWRLRRLLLPPPETPT